MEYLDDMFDQFSQAFLGDMVGEGDIPMRVQLNKKALDYSTKSLVEVDRYLKFLYKKYKNFTDIEYQNVVVWVGAYIGEVIRRNAKVEYHWVHYDEYMKDRDEVSRQMTPLTLSTHAFLVAVNSNYLYYMTMPMNKVARYLDEGPDNNISYYAQRALEEK